MGSEKVRPVGRRSALDLLQKIRAGAVDLQAVSLQERRICVAYLRLEGYTQDEIAEIFAVHRRTIMRDQEANRQDAARLVDELDARSMAGGLIGWAMHLTAKAIKEKDHALAWKIQRELVSDLQGLGYLPKAPEQHEVQVGTFADLARLVVEEGPPPAPEPLGLPEGGDDGSSQDESAPTDEAGAEEGG